MLKNILFYTAVSLCVIGLFLVCAHEGNLNVFFAWCLGFIPVIIAYINKWDNRSTVLVWSLVFLPIGWIHFFLTLKDKQKEQIKQKAEYICESCNETFGLPEKTNKFLKICGLLLIYGVILYLIESIPTNDISNLLPRFILDMAFIIIAIVHILMTLFKDSGRGKCPYCGATDFISINSVKGQNLVKQVKELRTKIKQQGEK